jgi:type II pantothenate kinase
MDNVEIRGRRGTLHFIRFPTAEMTNFLALAKSKGMAELLTTGKIARYSLTSINLISFLWTVCATGGGAFKFEQNFRQV